MKKRILITSLALILVLATVLPIALPTAANESPELVARWRFDGNAFDSSGNGNHGTVTGAGYVASDMGQALDFNGSSDYVIVPDDDTLDITGAITIEAWIEPSAVNSYRTIVSKRQGSVANYSLRLSGGKVEFYYRSPGDTYWSEWCTTGTPVTAGNKYHIAVAYVFGESDIAVYVNGVSYTGNWLHGDPEDVIGNSYTLYLGYNYPGYPQAFAGTIDEVQIWNGALTGDQLLNPPVPEVTWTVDDDGGDYSEADFTTIQAAINAASPGDNIDVYPGTYDPEINIAVPGWGGTYPAMGIVVWKDNLTIRAVNPDPASTVIQNTLGAWMDWWRIQHLTGGQWIGPTGTAQTGGFNPGTSASPNAIMIVKSGVTINGFTIHAPCSTPGSGYNASGVLIGGVAPGDPNSLGADNNIVQNCVFSDVWHGIYIWHSSGNQILNNTIEALGDTGHWAAISVYDGYSDAQISLGNLSENNLIANNSIENRGIFLGSWAPPSVWTSVAGSRVCFNTTTQVGVGYAHGPVMIGCNSGGFWHQSTDEVIRITGITYTGDTMLPSTGEFTIVNLAAQLTYDGSSDGSGIDIVFRVNDTDYYATTVAGGAAGTPVELPVGVYTVDANVPICDSCCKYKDNLLLVIYDPTGGFVTGGGWIDSPIDTEYQYMQVGGKATFGFVSKYQKGAAIPAGNTEFQFKTGDLNFKSTSYEWLVVTGSDYARYKGIGTINGTGEYKFMLWAGDNEPDTFRIKIWTENELGEETIAYDNGMDQPIGGGSIVVHTSKK